MVLIILKGCIKEKILYLYKDDKMIFLYINKFFKKKNFLSIHY